jgi:transcriptional regulator with XRE-family HTH domain
MSSPFAHLLHEMRVHRGLLQSELAQMLGYDQTYLSALEVGQKGPPTAEFVARLGQALDLTAEQRQALSAAAAASQRKLVIGCDAPREVFLLLDDLRRQLPSLGPARVRLIRDLLRVSNPAADSWHEPVRRVRRRDRQEAAM